MNPDLEKSLTALLGDLGAGDDRAWSDVLPSIYDQLRELAGLVAGPDAELETFTPTALVHDAWSRLSSKSTTFMDRDHFFAVAARTMRHLLVDRAREKAALKRGGNRARVTLSGLSGGADGRHDVVDLDDALTRLEATFPRQARVVELRFFAGLGVAEVASALELSVTTIEADWRLARAWLAREMS